MQPSAHKSSDDSTENKADTGQNMAILVEALYLTNLLLLPLLAFIVLAILYIKKHDSVPVLARVHMEQTIAASIWFGVILFAVTLTVMILNFVGVGTITIWMIVIIILTLVHPAMVMLGVIGLSKALSGKCWSYPLVGKPLPDDCPR